MTEKFLIGDELKRLTTSQAAAYNKATVEEKADIALRYRELWNRGESLPQASIQGEPSTQGRASMAASSSDTSLFGPFLIVIGLALVVWGFLFDPSVESSGGGLYGLSDRIVNIGRVADKMVIFTGGFGIVILGAIMTATNKILHAVRVERIRA